MSIFKKPNQTNSSVCLATKYKIAIGETCIEQTQNLTDKYVLIEAAGKKIMYLGEKDKQYIVDTEKNQLKELDLSAQMIQMNQIKALIGEVDIVERTEEEIRYISIQNKTESPAKMEVNLQTIEYPQLGDTIFQKFNEFQQSMQMFSVNLKENEIIKLSESYFSFNGKEQKVSLELVEIKSNPEIIANIDLFSNYKIIK